MSFRAILDQILKKLDLTYMGGEPFFTRGLKFQAKLTFYMPNQLNAPLFDIYSTECEYYWKAEESAPIRALAYFDEVLGWTIGDLNYVPYL
jgi:hypothetical protein